MNSGRLPLLAIVPPIFPDLTQARKPPNPPPATSAFTPPFPSPRREDRQPKTSDCTRDAAHTYFTTTYPNFMQCAGGLQDGATRFAQLLNMLHDPPTADQDPDDPVTFINTDIKATFQEMCRQTSFDTLTGKATQPYDDGRVQPDDDIPTINELRPFL
jgi:hypothetical protein